MSKEAKNTTASALDFSVYKRIFSYIKPYRKNFILALTTTILLAFISPIRPVLVKHTFDTYVANGDKYMLLMATLALFLLLFIEALFQFFDSFLTSKLGQSIIKDIRVQLFKHITRLRLKYYDNTPIGTIVTRVISDIEVIADIFSQGLIVIMGDLLKLVVILAVMLYSNWQLTLIVLIPIPLLLIATMIFKKAVSISFNEVRTQVAKLNAFVQEHVTGMGIVQIFNREEKEYKKFQKINANHRDANVKSIMAYSIFFPVVEILASFSLALLIWWGGKGLLSKTTSLGELLAFIMYVNMMFRPIRQLADRFNTLQMGVVSSKRVFAVLDTHEFIKDEGKNVVTQLKGEIEFQNVWFAYNNEDWILKNVSFKAKQGETIAFVGATGAGKTSVINLLSRFYEYNKGKILVDSIDIRDYTLDTIQKNIGIVMQDVFLYSDTILNNISLNNSEIKKETIIEASKKLGTHDFIIALPGGYDYNVKERGGMLSVGQRQLISILRAYVYNPHVLVLDEATSSIDTETERMIQHAIDKLTEGRTSIVIAHRLATIQKADRIILLDKGEIKETGTHQELLKLNGYYKRLYELQFVEEASVKH